MHFGSAHLLLFFVLAFLTSPEDMSEFRGILWGEKVGDNIWTTTSGPQPRLCINPSKSYSDLWPSGTVKNNIHEVENWPVSVLGLCLRHVVVSGLLFEFKG